jgi:RNA recognition motif-containing protein
MNILVFNLSFNLIDSDVRKMFSPFGVVNSAEVVKDKLNGRSKGKALIEMPVDVEAQQAITSLDQTIVDGKKISVKKEAFFSDWN